MALFHGVAAGGPAIERSRCREGFAAVDIACAFQDVQSVAPIGTLALDCVGMCSPRRPQLLANSLSRFDSLPALAAAVKCSRKR